MVWIEVDWVGRGMLRENWSRCYQMIMKGLLVTVQVCGGAFAEGLLRGYGSPVQPHPQKPEQSRLLSAAWAA